MASKKPIVLITVPGTFEDDDTSANPSKLSYGVSRWFDPTHDFVTEFRKYTGAPADHVVKFAWSTQNTPEARLVAGEALATKIQETAKERPGAILTLCGFSHGGTVIRHALAVLESRADTPRIDAIVSAGMPHVTDRQPALHWFEVLALQVLTMWVLSSYFGLSVWAGFQQLGSQVGPGLTWSMFAFAFTLVLAFWWGLGRVILSLAEIIRGGRNAKVELPPNWVEVHDTGDFVHQLLERVSDPRRLSAALAASPLFRPVAIGWTPPTTVISGAG